MSSYFGKIQDKDEDYYMQFNLIICGLDSVEARRWINATLVNMVDSDNPETSIEQSSTAGLFYHRTQVPVHAVDTLRVITSNLEVLRQEDFTEGYHQTLERAYRLLRLASQVLETIPREVVQSPPRIRNFAEYLKHQIDYLRAKVINPENLSNPDLERDIAKLRSCLRARTLHQKFLRSTQRI